MIRVFLSDHTSLKPTALQVVPPSSRGLGSVGLSRFGPNNSITRCL